jgi:hypothetical protein
MYTDRYIITKIMQLQINLVDNLKCILNACTIPCFKWNSIDDVGLLVNLVILEFVISQGVILVIVEFSSLI